MDFEMSMYQQEDNGKTSEMKKSMHLDFASENTKHSKFQNLIGNQELNMLKLASPELEKMLINQNGVVGTTPTPTQFIYPKYVTDEQEAYARGFVEALAELHTTQSGPSSAANTMSINNNTPLATHNQAQSRQTAVSTYSTLTPMSSAMISQSNSGYMNNFTGNPSVSRRHPPFAPSGLTVPNSMHNIPQSSMYTNMNVKSEPQMYGDHTVPRSPDSSRVTESPSNLSSGSVYDHVENINRLDSIPVDLEEQEKIKLERKRARNRIAARKCRTRKLERIGRLEEKVADLKSRNNELAQTAAGLNDQVMQLKQQIMEHIKSGCQIMMPEMRHMPAMMQ